MEGQEIAITFETLFELLRLEKNREELQTLSPTFLVDVSKYITEKQALINNREPSVFVNERDKIMLDNVKRLLRELYERREKKIVFMAINKSRTGSSIIDTSSLLAEEKELFEGLVAILDAKRNEMLFPLLTGSHMQKKQADAQIANETKLVKFTQAVPKFVGKELEVYGPFKEEDMANLPIDIAELLTKKGKAISLD